METTDVTEAQKPEQNNASQEKTKASDDQNGKTKNTGKRKPQTRKVSEYIMYVEEVLGIG